ncbi:excalibur calcium-binding domain-containing protein [Pseudomonas sp. PDM23]|uniref:excalibur calcium-binding domain-containing protein n=1 Tax=unclassified Pseudomonas TaxID=196821 RepID=UPI0017847004|nr:MULTISPECIES: excalibur calcium-binding domain-containing protein [unclassified Pseudomonas]MBD9576286.1 excalibur calcium-binding domain-containing protein [Pseudomonas sp. PDM23]MBD9670213.1 excalibur calcium-binding domain-containing protein [Pseudomonas sp. PDM21]
MKKWIFLAVIALLAWQYMDNPNWQSRFFRPAPSSVSAPVAPSEPAPEPVATLETRPEPTLSVRCDGRQHCSQMTSCAEAKAFLRSCPGMKMDGDHDGIPCEDQLCRM